MLVDFYDPNSLDNVETFPDREDVRYDDLSMKLDLFVPKNGRGPFPLIVWIPGGGWFGGNRGNCLPLQFGFCRRGYAAADLSYRTSSTTTRFPAQIQDLKTAVRWIRAHTEEYDIDPNRIGVMGTSAGGHLACLLGVTGKTRQFDVGDYLDQSSAIRAVCNFYGATNFLNIIEQLREAGGRTGTLRPMLESLFGGLPDVKTELASPITYVDKDCPPFLSIHGTDDDLVPFRQAELLHDKLVRFGVRSRLLPIPGGGHGDDRLFSPELLDKEDIFRFFDDHLRGAT